MSVISGSPKAKGSRAAKEQDQQFRMLGLREALTGETDKKFLVEGCAMKDVGLMMDERM